MRGMRDESGEVVRRFFSRSSLIPHLSFLILLILTACSTTPAPDHFEAREQPFSELLGWQQENHLEALRVFQTSCDALARTPRPTTTGSDFTISKSTWTTLCATAKRVGNYDEAGAQVFFETHFVPFRIANNGKEEGLFTGYYEPLLHGSLKKTGNYKYPVYGPPPELKRKKPYFTRKEINNGALAGRGLEIAWVDDPVMLFFMEIQGSGRIRLPDGREMMAGYADQNGHEYVALGKALLDDGSMEKGTVNFFTLRQWLYDHPDQAFAKMQLNPSYVFFKQRDTVGAVGSVGVVLSPERSMAIDPRYIPYGLPVYLETTIPGASGSERFQRLLITQDTGGAIRGPVRGDIFSGNGPLAEYQAGYMKNRGVYSVLVPRDEASQWR